MLVKIAAAIAEINGLSYYLDLIDMRRPYSSILLHSLYMITIKVAHPNAPSLALLKQLLQCQPNILDTLSPHPRRMDEEEVHIGISVRAVAVDLVDALHEARVVGVDAPQITRDFRREEDVLALDRTRRPQRRAGLGLVAVRLCAVDVPVARLQGHLDHRGAHGGVNLPHAEAQARHGHAVGELDHAVELEVRGPRGPYS